MTMRQTHEEREKSQLEVMEFLFKRNAPARLEQIANAIQQTKNETQYHCDELGKKGWIYNTPLPAGMTMHGEGTVYGFDLSASGRKRVMEGIA